MKKIIILTILLFNILFILSTASAQTRIARHHKKEEMMHARHAKLRYERMQMQLEQVRFHEEQEKRADRAQKEAEREGANTD